MCRACVGLMRRPGCADDRFYAPDAGVVVGDALELAVAAFAYEGALRRALQRLKYGGMVRVATSLARAALPAFDVLAAVSARCVLIPVPLHPERERERGYNQAALLAAHIGRQRRMEVRPLLRRQVATTRQHRLNRAERLRNLRDAFVPASSARPPPTVIVVDDILTTSATLEACAATLRAAGAEHVFGFAIAREV